MSQLVMDACSEPLDLLDGFDAPQDDLRAETSQRLIPDLKLIRVPRAFPQQFEERITLRERLVVFAQHACICRCGLCQREIKITAAVFGHALDDLRHLRNKDNRVEMTDDFINVFLHSIEQNFLAKALAVQHAHRFENEAYFKPVPALSVL